MSMILLKSGDLRLQVSPQGGAISGFWQHRTASGEPVALLRPITGETPSCFPLVPFGNRVCDNRFSFAGRDYRLKPNTTWDRYYLHGEGWQGLWSVDEQSSNCLTLRFAHSTTDTGYLYQARQCFEIDNNRLQITLAVKNMGAAPMPFGLGLHPYFTTTPQMTLWAPVQKFCQPSTPAPQPTVPVDMPLDVDFCRPRRLPARWIDNGLQSWIGKARIHWPEWQTALHIEADPLFRHAFLFIPHGENFFCFEPMSHLANGQNLPNLGDLTVLQPGEELSGSIRMIPQKVLC